MKTRIVALFLSIIMIVPLFLTAAVAEEKIWALGDSGEEVAQINRRLVELEYLEKDDGDQFTEATQAAVMAFQSYNGLLKTGMVDEVTWRVLFDRDAKKKDDNRWDIATEEDGALEFFSYSYSTGYAAPAVNTAPFGMSGTYGYSKSISYEDFNTNEYKAFQENGFLSVKSNPLSTFAVDVDTSSYAQIRRQVLHREKVSPSSVRIEEMLNYFHYDYKQPEYEDPFGVTIGYAQCPWNKDTKLLQIGLQAKSVPVEDRPAHNLVFLIDTSGSMDGSDRLDLVKRAFLLLLDELNPGDTVSIVAYASQDRVVLEGAKASEKIRIMEAISELEARGSTNGSAGITRAYEVAEKYFVKGGVNRILLATDGDLNVGVTSEGDLAKMVSDKKKSGISLTCMGFGMGNYKDNKMEALADYGDGNCWYIDSIYEARKALVTEADGTFITVAKDVKIQLDFNPMYVKGYRLIGYEDRLMAAEDFANDEKDGGEIGSGHRVTALYEIVPANSAFEFGEVESKYRQSESGEAVAENDGEMMELRIRAKRPDADESELYTYPIMADIEENLDDNMKFAAAVVETGMLLRDSEWKGTSTYESALELLRKDNSLIGDVYKEEFLYIVDLLSRD